MKKLNILLILNMFACISNQAQTLQAIAQLKKGDKIKHITVSYLDENAKATMALMGTPSADSTVSEVILELVEENNNELIFSSKIMMDEQAKTLFGEMNLGELPEQKYLIVTNKDGSNPRLKDVDAAVKAYKQQTDHLVDAIAKNPEMSPMLSMLKPIIESMKEMFPEEFIRKLLLEDIYQSFIFQGEKIEKGSIGKKANLETIGMSGSMFLKTNMDYRLVNYNEGKKNAIINANYITDREHLVNEGMEMTKRMMAKMPAAMGNNEMPSDEELKQQIIEQFSAVNMNFTRTYYFDLKTGMPYMIVEKNVQKDENGKLKESIKKRIIKLIR